MKKDQHEKINYVEFPCRDLQAAKVFFGDVFGWQFQDYGEEYVAILGAGIDGGFYLSDKHSATEQGSVLLVLYSKVLDATQEKIVSHGGEIVQQTFDFPGGRRFHFSDPSGNEWAVWSDQPALAGSK